MKIKRNISRVTALLLCLLLCTALLPTALAANLEDVESCTLDLSYLIGDDPNKQPMENVEFRIYRVADITDALTFKRIEPFSEYAITATDWLVRASTMAGYVSRDNVTPTDSAVTNAEGKVFFENLEKGLYLIVGDSKTVSGYIYTPTPFLLSLPYTDDGYTWEPNVVTYAKYTRRMIPSVDHNTLALHALKVWHDDGYEDERPESVIVDLLRDGDVYDTVVLNSENNWRCDWEKLDDRSEWQLVEREIDGYSVSVTQNDITFLVTNTREPDDPIDIPDEDDPTADRPDKPDDPDEEWDFPYNEDDPNGGNEIDPDPNELGDEIVDIEDGDTALSDLPNTGVLWWPVPVLAIAGVALILLGVIRRRRGVGEDEA